MKFKAIFIIISAVLVWTCPASSAVLVLKSGERIEGQIVDVSDKAIFFQSGQDISNYSYGDIQDINSFSEEERQKGLDAKATQTLAASRSLLAGLENHVSREISQDELRQKAGAFRDYVAGHFGKNLKADEKEVLEGLKGVLSRPPAPVPSVPENATPTPEDIIRRYEPYQSELHEKILKLLRRYLEEWIARAKVSQASLGEEDRFLERVIGKARLAFLRSALPSAETLRDRVDRYLKNVDALHQAVDHAIKANQ